MSIEFSGDLAQGLIAGIVLGFILGYITNHARNAKRIAEEAAREVHEVIEHDDERKPPHDEAGSVGDGRNSAGDGSDSRISEGDEHGEHRVIELAPGDQVQTPFQRKVTIAVVAFTAIAAIMSGFFWTDANDTLHQADQRSKEAKAISVANRAELDDINARQEALDKDQAEGRRITQCQQEVIEDTLVALKARATFGEQSNRTQLRMIQAQILFLQSLAATNDTDSSDPNILRDYLTALTNAKTSIQDQLKIRDIVPYPFLTAIKACAHPPPAPDDLPPVGTGEDPSTGTGSGE